MQIGIPRESLPGERRVAATPQSVKKFKSWGFSVVVERSAGEAAHFLDVAYEEAGAEVVDMLTAWSSDVILKVLAPTTTEIALMKKGATLISFIWPAQNRDLLTIMGERGLTVLAMDQIPRISRAQKMDVLSSMANIAGYKAILLAADHFGSFFTGQITAAGKVPPAKVLVIGAGVAGLAAIGTAKGLGAIVRAFDTRPAVKDQVKSMGGEFLELDFEEDGEGAGGYAKEMSPAFIEAEMALFTAQAKEVDIIVTTALIPGKKAPTLITRDMIKHMRPGSVIVDLAAEQGGNCELTVPGEAVTREGVTIIGYTDLPSRLPTQASVLFANNMAHLIADMTCGGKEALRVNHDDEVVRGALVLEHGKVMWPPPKKEPAQKPPKPAEPNVQIKPETKKERGLWSYVGVALLAVLVWVLGTKAPSDFLQHLSVFVLACIVGWQVVWNVTPALHTPLMSVTNAISGIIVVGAMVQLTGDLTDPSTILAALAVLIAMINVAGGFLVTQRMLKMFRK